MSSSQKWFDRTFRLGLSNDLLDGIVDRLRRAPDRVERLLADLPADLLTHRDGGSWSILENVGHLEDLESLWHGRLDDFASRVETLRPADLENRKTHEANHNARPPREVVDGFRSARAKVVKTLEGAPPGLLEVTALHPRLRQPMRMVDLAFFVAEHDDHHLARIQELARTLGGVKP